MRFRSVLLALALTLGLTAPALAASPITHIIWIMQENRTPCNLMQGLPAEATICGTTCQTSDGGPTTPYTEINMAGSIDPSHTHAAWLTDYNGGLNNGFTANHCAFVNPSQVTPYTLMASTYAYTTRFFQTNRGPSYPAHQYMASGASTVADGSNTAAAENPNVITGGPGGCDSNTGTTVETINLTTGAEPDPVNPTPFPCFLRKSIMAAAVNNGTTFAMYQAASGAGLWKTFDSNQDAWCLPAGQGCFPTGPGTGYTSRVIHPQTQFVSDVAAGTLANVTFITPNNADSDHAGLTDGSGPCYVASLVNAVGQSPFWNTSLIIIDWDDWGGWYDPIAPPTGPDQYSISYRVPNFFVGPYVKLAFTSSVQYDFRSILKLIENNFSIPAMGTEGTANDPTNDVQNYAQSPNTFAAINPPLCGTAPPPVAGSGAYFGKHKTPYDAKYYAFHRNVGKGLYFDTWLGQWWAAHEPSDPPNSVPDY